MSHNDSTTCTTSTTPRKLPPCPICGSTQLHSAHTNDVMDFDQPTAIAEPDAVIVATPAGPQFAWAAMLGPEPVQLSLKL